MDDQSLLDILKLGTAVDDLLGYVCICCLAPRRQFLTCLLATLHRLQLHCRSRLLLVIGVFRRLKCSAASFTCRPRKQLVHEESMRRHDGLIAPAATASSNEMQQAYMISPNHISQGGVMGGQRCPYFLATDYFVNADGSLPRHLQKGMDQCFVQVMGDPSLSDTWYALQMEDMRKAVKGIPEMMHAFK